MRPVNGRGMWLAQRPQVELFLLLQHKWIGVRQIALVCQQSLISLVFTRRCRPERRLPGHARNKGMSGFTEFGSAMREHQRKCFLIALRRDGIVCVFKFELPCHGIAFLKEALKNRSCDQRSAVCDTRMSQFDAFPSRHLLRFAAGEHGYKILMTNHADHRDAKYW